MRHIVEEFAAQRLGEPLDKTLNQDEKYQKRKKQYHEALEEIKKYLNIDNPKDLSVLLRLDEAVGDYSASYGDVAYSLGFYDGMGVGMEYGNTGGEQREKTMEITMEDMEDLIQVHDACKALNIALHGAYVAYAFNEGIFGKMGKIYEVISRHISSRFQENDVYEEERILADTSLDPKERARLLMME